MLKANLNSFPDLETPTLYLKKLTKADELVIFQLRSDDIVNKFLDRPKASSIEDARSHISKLLKGTDNSDLAFWMITPKNLGVAIGTICLWNISVENKSAEIGYDLLPAYHQQGIMKEAFMKVVQFAFETMELKYLEAWVHSDNARSIKLLEKNFFERDPLLESKIESEQDKANLQIYVLSNKQFRKKY